jgi:hypothetical protein
MSENKTKPTTVSPTAFLKTIDNAQRQRDGRDLLKLMQEVTGERPQMWGPSIIGFGKYQYRYESGREGENMITGFSPRKQNLVLYLGPGLQDEDLRSKLGKHKVGKGCLYINKLEDVDRNVLRKLIESSVCEVKKRIG